METIAHLRALIPSLRHERGQTMAEYAVILAVVAVAVVAAIVALSGGISSAINKVTDVLP